MPPLHELEHNFKPKSSRRAVGNIFAASAAIGLVFATSGVAFAFSLPHVLTPATQFVQQLAARGAADVAAIQQNVAYAYVSLCPFFKLCNTVATTNSHPEVPAATANVASAAAPSTDFATTTATPSNAIAAAATSSPTVIQNITNPIRERVVEKVVTTNAHPDSWFAAQLATLENKLSTEIVAVSSRPIPVPTSGPSAPVSVTTFAQGQTIGSLTNTAINNSTITGGSITAASIAGTIGNAIATAVGTIDALTATTLVATNSTFTNSTTTNATTTNLAVTGTATIGSGTGIVQANSGVVSAIANGTNGQVLKMVSGVPSWAVETGGDGGGASAWATTSDSLAVYTTDPTQTVLIGTSATSTTGNIVEAKGNALVRGNVVTQGIVSASSFTATSTTNSSLPNVTHTNSTTTNATTTTFAATIASTTKLTTGSLSIASLSGFLRATAGVSVTDPTFVAGQVNRPFSSRLANRQKPWPSQ